MHTYIYTCFSTAQLCLHDQLHACMRMPHMHRSHIDFLTLFTIRTSQTLLFSLRCLRFLMERRYYINVEPKHTSIISWMLLLVVLFSLSHNSFEPQSYHITDSGANRFSASASFSMNSVLRNCNKCNARPRSARTWMPARSLRNFWAGPGPLFTLSSALQIELARTQAALYKVNHRFVFMP